MKDFLYQRFEDMHTFLKSELTEDSYQIVTNTVPKGSGSYKPWFFPSKNTQQKMESKYGKIFTILQKYKNNSQAISLITQEEAQKQRPPSP